LLARPAAPCRRQETAKSARLRALRDGAGRLHFAGEHTCYAFVGYMEGALDSGAAVARRLAGRDGVIEAHARAPARRVAAS
jgi:monoamine oxidase